MNRTEYTETLLSQLRRVTPKEREAIRQEIDGHIEDHICALPELGYDRELAEERTMARMGIAMNTAMDDTDSHIAQMLIEGSTMSVTEMTRLAHRFGKQKDCDELVDMANEIVTFEQGQIERMKQYL